MINNTNKRNVNKTYTRFGLLLIVITLLVLLSSVNVHALGLAPSKDVINYDTNDHTFTLRVINNEHKDMDIAISPQGNLSQYVVLDSTKIHLSSADDEKSFQYRLRLPANLNPGAQTVDIAVEEIPTQTSQDVGSAIVFSSNVVVHELVINVPYPGLYADGILFISNGNVNDTITFTSNIINKGSQTISQADGELVILGPTNEELYRIKSNSISNLVSKSSDKLVINWKANVNPGIYYAEFINTYDGKQFVLRKIFVVGNYNVEIKGIKVNDFRLGAIAKFDISVINKWNQPIQNVYGQMQIIDPQGNVLTTFKTVPVDLEPLTTSTIQGYWDTKDVKVGDYDAKVTIFYSASQSERLFKTVVGINSISVNDVSSIGNIVASNSNGNSTSIWVILVAILVIINIGWFVYFKVLKKKDNGGNGNRGNGGNGSNGGNGGNGGNGRTN